MISLAILCVVTSAYNDEHNLQLKESAGESAQVKILRDAEVNDIVDSVVDGTKGSNQIDTQYAAFHSKRGEEINSQVEAQFNKFWEENKGDPALNEEVNEQMAVDGYVKKKDPY